MATTTEIPEETTAPVTDAATETEAPVASESAAVALEVIDSVSELATAASEAVATLDVAAASDASTSVEFAAATDSGELREIVLKGEMYFSELPVDGTELRSQLTLHLDGEEVTVDSVKLTKLSFKVCSWTGLYSFH